MIYLAQMFVSNLQTYILCRQVNLIQEKDAFSPANGNRTAGAFTAWQSRSCSLRFCSAAVILIHYSSWNTGPKGDIQGLSLVPASRLQGYSLGGFNWERENDDRWRYSVVKHNDLAHSSSVIPFSLLFLHFSQLMASQFSCLIAHRKRFANKNQREAS